MTILTPEQMRQQELSEKILKELSRVTGCPYITIVLATNEGAQVLTSSPLHVGILSLLEATSKLYAQQCSLLASSHEAPEILQ